MEDFIIGVGAAAISGLTFIAYQHPELFEKEFSAKIAYISIGVILAAIFHDTGVSSAQHELIPLIKDGLSPAVKAALEKAKTNDYIYLASLGALFYGMFLSWLAKHRTTEDSQDN